MDTQEIAEALEAWAADSHEELSAYPHEPPNYLEAFPIVAARVVDDEEQVVSDDFSQRGYQQVHVRVITVELNILANPEPEWEADKKLYEIVDALRASLKRDKTLGQRVEGASPLYRVTYEGEVETSDGARANLAIFRITLGQSVEAR